MTTKQTSNFDRLTQHAAEAREALARIAPPSCDDPDSGDGLYYPLLFLTTTVEDTLLAIVRRAYADMQPEMAAAAEWLHQARVAATPSGTGE